jgi:N-acetylmuramoyl-L-alanine amidase
MEAELEGIFRVNPAKTDLATAIGAKQGALTGSIYSQIPVLLVELCVLTNPKDEAFILSSKGRRSLAGALAKAAIAAVAD